MSRLDEEDLEGLEEDLEGLDPETLRQLAESRVRSRRKSGGRSKKLDPQPLSRLLGPLFRKWGIAEQVARASVLEEWEERVGSSIAERTRPVRVSDDTLFVEVESSSWLMELRMMKRELLERINAGRGRGRIEDIVFVQGEGRR